MPESNVWVWPLIVLLVAFVAVRYSAGRIRQVPEGYVAVIEKMDRLERTVGPGTYVLHPLEEEVARIFVRQREAAFSVPNVVTDGNLGVTVNLRYAYSLDPHRMNSSEIYYTDAQRTEQQRSLLKRAFGEVMYKLSQIPMPESTADEVYMLRLFSPFVGPKARALDIELDMVVRSVLLRHGIVVSSESIVVEGLTLPPLVADAYGELLQSSTGRRLRADFISGEVLTAQALRQISQEVQGPLRKTDDFQISAPAQVPPQTEDDSAIGTNPLLNQIVRALSAAYTRDELRRVLRLGMNITLEDLVADKPFTEQVFELVMWADRQGRVVELVDCAYQGNRGNRELAAVSGQLIEPKSIPAEPLNTAPEQQTPLQSSTSRLVYLAYSRKDHKVMRRLRADLLQAGIQVWVDDHDLEPGTPVWQQAIQSAIREAFCMIVIMSPDACESKWVNNEITLADRRNLRIFPILVRGDVDQAVPLALVNVHFVDGRSDYTGAVHSRLLPAVLKHLAGSTLE